MVRYRRVPNGMKLPGVGIDRRKGKYKFIDKKQRGDRGLKGVGEWTINWNRLETTDADDTDEKADVVNTWDW